MNNIEEIKKKREFSELPDSVVSRVADLVKGDIKEARALLRKYFGVFLTNKVLKGKGDLLRAHMSSRKRDYEKFYDEIFSCVGEVGSVIDLGCGVNGFSYEYLPKGINYIGVEAAGQVVSHTNNYFERNGFDARAVVGDLFDVGLVIDLLKVQAKPRVVFLFQIVDAWENLERNFSKKFILEISGECEWIVLTLPTESLGGCKKFMVQRKWMIEFFDENFDIKKDFKRDGERVLVVRLKNKK